MRPCRLLPLLLLGLVASAATASAACVYVQDQTTGQVPGGNTWIEKISTTGADTVTSMQVYFSGVSGNLAYVGVYADNAVSGTPGTLLASSAQTAISNGWNDISFTSGVALSAATTYWIALAADQPSVYHGTTFNGSAQVVMTGAYGALVSDPTVNTTGTTDSFAAILGSGCVAPTNTPASTATPTETPNLTQTSVAQSWTPTPTATPGGGTCFYTYPTFSSFETGGVSYLQQTGVFAAGSVSQAQVYVTSGAGHKGYVALYADNVGAPGALLGSSIETNLVDGWNSIAFQAPVSVTDTAQYWFSVSSDSTAVGHASTFSAGGVVRVTSAYAAPASNPTVSNGPTVALAFNLGDCGPMPTDTPTDTPVGTATNTPTATATQTPNATQTSIAQSWTPTNTPAGTATATATPTWTATPTDTPTPTATATLGACAPYYDAAGNGALLPGSMVYVQSVTLTVSAIVSSVTIHVSNTSGTTGGQVGIYADAGGFVGNRMTASNFQTFAEGANVVSMAGPVSMSASTFYWVAVSLNEAGASLEGVSGTGASLKQYAYQALTDSPSTSLGPDFLLHLSIDACAPSPTNTPTLTQTPNATQTSIAQSWTPTPTWTATPTGPVISGVSPQYVAANTAATINLSGSGFGSTAASLTGMTYGPTGIEHPLSSPTWISSTLVTGITGTDVNPGDVIKFVVAINGVSSTASTGTVTGLTVPAVTALSPATVTANTPAVITITGTDFGSNVADLSVVYGTSGSGSTLSNLALISPTQITGTLGNDVNPSTVVYVKVIVHGVSSAVSSAGITGVAPTATPTWTPTWTATPTPTWTPTATATPTWTPTWTATPTPTWTPTATATAALPVISSINPQYVAANTSARISLYGSNIGPITGVTYGVSGTGSTATSPVWLSSTLIQATVGSDINAGESVKFVVYTSGGNSAASTATLTGVTVPAVTALSPATVTASTATLITITGTDFGSNVADLSVSYGPSGFGSTLTNLTLVSPTQITGTLGTDVGLGTTVYVIVSVHGVSSAVSSAGITGAAPTPTPTSTATPTWTPTVTATPTWTATPTATWTPTWTPTDTPTWTPSNTPTATPNATQTAAAQQTVAAQQTANAAATQTAVAAATQTAVVVATSTAVAQATATAVATQSATPVVFPTPIGCELDKVGLGLTKLDARTPQAAAPAAPALTLIAPQPALPGQPVCLVFNQDLVSARLELHSLDGARVAALDGAGGQLCFTAPAPGIYLLALEGRNVLGESLRRQTKLAVAWR